MCLDCLAARGFPSCDPPHVLRATKWEDRALAALSSRFPCQSVDLPDRGFTPSCEHNVRYAEECPHDVGVLARRAAVIADFNRRYAMGQV